MEQTMEETIRDGLKQEPKPEPKQLTVRDLIALLEAIEDKSKLVESDGCDCTGPARGVVEADDGTVLVCR